MGGRRRWRQRWRRAPTSSSEWCIVCFWCLFVCFCFTPSTWDIKKKQKKTTKLKQKLNKERVQVLHWCIVITTFQPGRHVIHKFQGIEQNKNINKSLLVSLLMERREERDETSPRIPSVFKFVSFFKKTHRSRRNTKTTTTTSSMIEKDEEKHSREGEREIKINEKFKYTRERRAKYLQPNHNNKTSG